MAPPTPSPYDPDIVRPNRKAVRVTARVLAWIVSSRQRVPTVGRFPSFAASCPAPPRTAGRWEAIRTLARHSKGAKRGRA